MTGNPNPASTSSDSYNRIPYPKYAYSQTHPDLLATLAILSGVDPQPVERCRTLELGCSSGTNLIPIAYSLPNSEFVGVDLSSHAIAEAKEGAARLELSNISFQNLDVLDVGEALGKFDYIIAHGIFSWVPLEVQNHIFSICRDLLSPNGVAYISYNVYPGWHVLKTVRDLMFFHTRDQADDDQRILTAKKLIDYLSSSLPEADPFIGQVYSRAMQILRHSDDGYIRHDFLEEVNEPIYFTEFVDRARKYGLEYMANADLSSPRTVPIEIMETVLADVTDDIEIEQYMDFLRNQSFRQTLLCHQELSVSRVVDLNCFSKLRISSQVKPTAEVSKINTAESLQFSGPGEQRFTIDHPLTRAALIHLGTSFPLTVSFEELAAEAWRLLGPSDSLEPIPDPPANEVDLLKKNLFRLYGESIDLLSFHSYQPSFVLQISDRPVASPVARHQARNDLHIMNLYHQRVSMESVPRHLLTYLDGQFDREDLLNIALESEQKGLLEVAVDGEPITDQGALREQLELFIQSLLEDFTKAALLVS